MIVLPEPCQICWSWSLICHKFKICLSCTIYYCITKSIAAWTNYSTANIRICIYQGLQFSKLLLEILTWKRNQFLITSFRSLLCVNSMEGVRTMKPLSNANYINQLNDFALNLDEQFCHNVPLRVRPPDFQVINGNFYDNFICYSNQVLVSGSAVSLCTSRMWFMPISWKQIISLARRRSWEWSDNFSM